MLDLVVAQSGEGIFEENLHVLITTLGVIITGLFTFFGVKVTQRGELSKVKEEHSTPSWEAFVEKIEGFYGAQADSLSKRITDLENQVRDIMAELKKAKERLEIKDIKYMASIFYIKTVHTEYPEVEKALDVPEEIAEDVN